MKIRKTVLLFALCVILLGTACCKAADAPQMPAAGVVIDQGGRRIDVSEPFERIISLYGAHTENLYTLDADKQLIGVSRHETYPSPVRQKPAFSYHDDPEKFLAARPDLVLVRPMIDRAYPQLITRLEQSGITVASLQPADVADMYTYWKVLGVLTGQTVEAMEMVRRFKSAVAAFQRLAASVERPKYVYFEAIHHKMKTFTPRAMAIFALETAGGINLAEDARQVRTTNIAFYGKERILAKADQIDVYLAQTGVMNRPTVEQIQNEPGFQIIKAVQNDHVYIIDEMIISRPTFRLLQGIAEIGRILYPSVFDVRAHRILKDATFSTRFCTRP